MLKNIRLHIEKDEQNQAQLDQKLAAHILTTHNTNINAFQRNIPSLLPYVQNTDLANYSIFINKFGENNIVDYGMGRTFYGFHPEDEVLEQYSRIKLHCPEVVFSKEVSEHIEHSANALSLDELKGIELTKQQAPMPYEIECLVVLGCGLGIHLRHLLENHKIKNLLIYEPELQYFQCSVMTTSWQNLFTLAKQRDTGIFLQLEKDGRDLIQDINELIAHCGISGFHLYKHYNHQVFDSIYQDLTERSWNEIVESGFKLKSKDSYLDFLPSWTPNVDLDKHALLTAPNQTLTKNLNTFKRFFPEIYQEYKNYAPKKWLPIANANGEVNLVKVDSLRTWYGESPKHDCTLNFENFDEQPNKDGLVLGYKGTKLAHYIHYQFVKETEELLEQAEEEVGALPEKVPSIIMFGLGVGYQLEKLLDEHSVEKLFICEPNPDFFYASLFAIDWQAIFEKVEKSDSRIYLNVGDDGTNLFRDLLKQFYAIGPYILNSTYFYQSYYNASLNSAISQLREQLQVVISMGEYFDHAYYGIAHTTEGMRRKIPILAANPASKLSYDDKEVPIFIVGNGPSLDSSIDAIKEWQGQAIVVSCGTALQALHRNGITPDFHAEIEQNRSTFDWAVLIGDLDYLKNITLISCNGIHPDTCDLYKDVMIAFKEGESSTISALNVLGRENFTTLLNSFPTVSNFAIDLFSTIGFTSIYLIGVDLGFVDVKHHHSKSSGYYHEDGKETYEYAQSANTSLIVPGNFRLKVNTKHEFKVSRQVIEQVTSGKPKGQDFYNCSDGAKIQGALPIRPNELLIVASAEQKSQAIKTLITVIFSSENLDNYSEKFISQFSHKHLIKELEVFETLIDKSLANKEEVDQLINRQKEMLFTSYKTGKSLLFYYLYGTVNYANAMLTRLAFTKHADDTISEKCSEMREKWRATIGHIKTLIDKKELGDLDVTSFHKIPRERELYQQQYQGESVLIISDTNEYIKACKVILQSLYPWFKKTVFLTYKESKGYSKSVDYCVFIRTNNQQKLPIIGKVSTLILSKTYDQSLRQNDAVTQMITPKMDRNQTLCGPLPNALIALTASFNAHKCQVILPKYQTCNTSTFDEKKLGVLESDDQTYDFGLYMAIFAKNSVTSSSAVSHCGSRGKAFFEPLRMKDLIYKNISKDKLASVSQKQDQSLY